jgi:hypothetical protein
MSTKEAQAAAAYASIVQPVTEASFTEWYMKTHNKKAEKRPFSPGDTGDTSAKRAELIAVFTPTPVPTTTTTTTAVAAVAAPAPAAAAAAAAVKTAAPLASRKGKNTAFLKGLSKALKTNAKGKRWHTGDREVLTGSLVLAADDFAALLAGIPVTATSPVITSFSLSCEELTTLFGTALGAINVKTWSRPRSFRKSYSTGMNAITFRGAEGRFSKNTSTLTLKASAVCGEGGDDIFGGMFDLW